MEISEEQLNSYIELYKKEFGKDIDRVEALAQAKSLIRFLSFTTNAGDKDDKKAEAGPLSP